MARKGRRPYRKYLKGNVNEDQSVVLASKALGESQFDETVNERTLVSSLVVNCGISGWTYAAGEGPVLLGISHSDYSSAEIEEVIENLGSWNEGDLVSQEIGRRKVRLLGSLADNGQLNDGKPMKVKLNWVLLQGQTLNFWVYNTGSGAIGEGTAFLDGHANLWPL